MRPVENKYGLQLGMIGDFQTDLLNNGTSGLSILLGDNEASAVGKPLYKGSGTEPESDISARGIHWDMGGSGHKAISLSKIPTKSSAMSYPVPTIPPKSRGYSCSKGAGITFCFKPSNATDTTWQLSGYGNGPCVAWY